ncbi:hypothetical protein MRX96_015614 [Rhipicephalus microplus]
MSNRSTSRKTKGRNEHSPFASGEAAGGETEDKLKPRSRDVHPQPGKDSSLSSSSDSGGRFASGETAPGDQESTAEADLKSELLDAGIHDFTRSDQSGGSRQDRWRPRSGSHDAEAAGSLSEYSDDVDTLTEATTQAFTAVPAASSTAMLVAREEPKHEPFLKTIAKASFSVSSFSFNEPLAQVSIAFFSMCLLFVIVACSVIVYSCGEGAACAAAGDPASNGTAEAARAHRKTELSKSGHVP